MNKIKNIVLLFMLILLISGCSSYIKRDNQNNLIRQNYSDQIKNSVLTLTPDQKYALSQDIKSIKYAFNRNDEIYRIKMVNVKNKYTSYFNQNYILLKREKYHGIYDIL